MSWKWPWDITEQKNAEKELQRLNNELEDNVLERTSKLQQAYKDLENSAQKLQDKNQELEDFTRIASHDLKAPLRKLLTFNSILIKTDNQDEKTIELCNRMNNSVLRMQDLIDGLLELSRVSIKSPSLQLTDLNSIVNDVLEDLHFHIQDSKGKIIVPEKLPKIHVDPIQIRQLFQNLLGNALKFRKKDVPPVIEVLTQSGNNGQWEFIIKDNGIGFEQEHSNLVFKPFERLTPRGHFEGSGMGLAICQKIVERHEGTIEVQSQVNIGTTFKISLPKKTKNNSA